MAFRKESMIPVSVGDINHAFLCMDRGKGDARELVLAKFVMAVVRLTICIKEAATRLHDRVLLRRLSSVFHRRTCVLTHSRVE